MKNDRRILIVSSAHPWDDERIYNKMAKSLSKKYLTFLIATADFDYIKRDSITIFGLKKRSRWKRYKNYINMWKIAKDIKPHIIHFHDPDLLLLGLFFKVFLRAKVIYDVHEDYPLVLKNREYIPNYLKPIISFLFNVLEKTISFTFDAVITVTEEIAVKFKNKNVQVIKNYPVLDMYNNSKIYVENEALRLIYIGNISIERGIDNLIKAVENITNYNIILDLYGPVEVKEYEKRLMSLQSEKIKYYGRVPKSEIPKILANHDVGMVTLLPYERYQLSLPLKMFEYMASGLPVIASNFKKWTNIINDNNCGILVDPTNIQEIIDAILYYCENRNRIKLHGENGKNAVKQYSWANEEAKLNVLYEKLLYE